jgi:hypothetical protein
VSPKRALPDAVTAPAAPGAKVFHAIAWWPQTHRWVRGIAGFVAGCAICVILHDYWGGRPPWLDTWPAILGPAAALASLGALLPVPRPWLRLDIDAQQLTLHGRGGLRLDIPTADIRVVAGEGGVGLGPVTLFWKYLYFATPEGSFRLKLHSVRSQRCFDDMLAACQYAIGIDFDGSVRMPDLSGAPAPQELVRCALAVASTELRRQARRALLGGTTILLLASAGGMLLLQHSLLQSVRHSGLVAAGIIAGALLIRHGVGRLARCRAVARQAKRLIDK